MLSAILLLSITACAATLFTLDGKCLDGDLRILPTGQIRITPKSGAPLQIPFSNLLFLSLDVPPAPPPTPPSDSPADDTVGPLSVQSVGKVTRPADAGFNNGLFCLRGNGLDLTGDTDTFHFYCRGFYGNCELVARLDSISTPNTRAGLMFREDKLPDSPHAALIADSTGELSLCYRAKSGDTTRKIPAGKTTFPIFLRLVRSSRQFSGYTSVDSKTWQLVARVFDDDNIPKDDPRLDTLGVDMASGAIAGIAFLGGLDKTPGTATFDQVVLRNQFAEAFDSSASNSPAQYRGAPNEYVRKGLLLRTGAFIPDVPLTPTDSSTLTVTINDQSHAIDLAQVARFQQQNLPTSALAHLPPHLSGVLLPSGDFMEGEITHIDGKQVEVSNITLGLSTYPLETRVRAILFHDVDTTPTGFRVELTNRSILLARALNINSAGDLVIDDYTLGQLTLPLKQILSIQGAIDHVTALINQQPTTEAPPGHDVQALTAFDRANSFWLSTASSPVPNGILTPGGATITYQIPTGSRALVTRAAVPEILPEKSAVRFIILADNREIFRSPPLSSRDQPLPINLPLNNAKTLSLRVESATPDSDLPTLALWSTPLLLR